MRRKWASKESAIVGTVADDYLYPVEAKELTDVDLEELKRDAIVFATSHQPERTSSRVLEARLDASEFEAWADRFNRNDKDKALDKARQFTEQMLRGHRNEARVARLLRDAGLDVILFEPELLGQYQTQSPDIAIVLPGERVILVECKSKTSTYAYVEQPTDDGFYRDFPEAIDFTGVEKWKQHVRSQRRWATEQGYEIVDTIVVVELPLLPDEALVQATADALGWSVEDVQSESLLLPGYIVIDGSTEADWNIKRFKNQWSGSDDSVYSVPHSLFLSLDDLITHAHEQAQVKPRIKRGNR